MDAFVLHRNGTETTLGPGFAWDINDRGTVAGIGDDRTRAFLWDPHTGDVVFLSQEPPDAFDVNDRGEVVGWNGYDAREAVIWRVRP